MSEVIAAEQQLELVNIVEVVQSNLSKNFILVLKRLNHHDAIFAQYQLNNQTAKQQTLNQILQLQKTLLDHKASVYQRFQEVLTKVQMLADNMATLRSSNQENKSEIKQINQEIFRSQLKLDEKFKEKQKQALEITRHVKLLAMEQNRLNQQVSKKENRVQAQKIFKQTEILKDKNNHIESELKIAHHKIEKMQILNEKAERMQAKKEVEIFKQIEERVKKEIKSNLKSPIIPINQNQDLTSITMISNTVGKNGQSSISSSSHPINPIVQSQSGGNEIPQLFERSNRRASISVEDGGSQNGNVRSNLDFYLQKWGNKMKVFQTQIKQIIENLKILNKNSGKKDRQTRQNGQEGVKEKINELKPQIVKLWAKIDTIDDKVSFNQRKIDEKMKNINQLATFIKENNVSRLEQKVKNMQTEIFTSLKQIKAKLQGKLNQTDHEKYVKLMEEKIVQINDAIYLKSDKLEVKKALLFLESKIKQIILVISQDEQNEKDALLTKKQLKCISCDKQLDKFSGIVSSPKGNWDCLPYKDHPSEVLGRFGMTNYGSLSKKIKKLEGKDLPILNKKNSNHSFQVSS